MRQNTHPHSLQLVMPGLQVHCDISWFDPRRRFGERAPPDRGVVRYPRPLFAVVPCQGRPGGRPRRRRVAGGSSLAGALPRGGAAARRMRAIEATARERADSHGLSLYNQKCRHQGHCSGARRRRQRSVRRKSDRPPLPCSRVSATDKGPGTHPSCRTRRVKAAEAAVCLRRRAVWRPCGGRVAAKSRRPFAPWGP